LTQSGAEFEKIDLTTKIEEVLPMTKMAVADYINKNMTSWRCLYRLRVAIKQLPGKILLPFGADKISGE